MSANPLKQPKRGFEIEEFATRLEKAQSKMQEQQLAGILLTTEHDINYFTGFLTQFWQSPTRPWYVVLPAVGKPIAVIPEIGVNCIKNGWVEDVRSWSSPHATDDGVSLLIQALTEVIDQSLTHNGHNAAAIGINRGRETHIRMPLDDFEVVSNALLKHHPKAVFADATQIMRRLRMVKSPAEIEKLFYIAQTVSGVFEQLFEFVEVGMLDSDIFRAFKIECLKAGADDVAYLVGASDKDGYDDIISPPSGHRLEDGHVLILDTGSTFDGYYCDYDRNYAFGKVDASAFNAYAAVWEATEAGLAVCKPGNSCRDIFNAMNEVMQANGAMGESVGRYGHGLGLQLTEPPSHTSWDDTVLEAGMVLTLEPGMIYAPNKMMVHEENIVITETGVEMLSRRASPEMPTK